jgi:hypothetical protein
MDGSMETGKNNQVHCFKYYRDLADNNKREKNAG